MIEVKEVIVTDMTRKGSGLNEKSPVRAVTEVYSKQGDLIASRDPFGNYSIEQMIEFGRVCRQDNELSVIELFRRWSGG